MNYFMPFDLVPVPKVGADPSLSAFISFAILQNPSLTLFNFIVPVKLWSLLVAGTFFVVVSDSTFKNLGGLMAGVLLGLMKRRLYI